MDNASVLGIDLGTTTVKVVVINAQTKEVVASSSLATEACVPSEAGPLGNEQDVRKIMSILESCMSLISVEILKTVIRIGICGQMHGLVMWKRQPLIEDKQLSYSQLVNRYSILSHLYTWQDGRCGTEFLASLPKPHSHLRVATGFGCATMFWLTRHEPGSLAVYSCAGTVQDFLVTALCDLEKPIMTPHNAASWGYFDTVSCTWNKDILLACDFPIQLLADVTEPGSFAGKTCCCWHGIAEGTPVTAAMGDLQCHILSKLHDDTDAVVNIGTSAQFTFIMPKEFNPSTDIVDHSSPVEYCSYFDGRYLAEAASLNGGNVVAAFVKMLHQWNNELGLSVSEQELWEKLSALAEVDSPLESSDVNLTIIPTLLGERHIPDQRGVSVTNAIPSNVSIGSVYRTLSHGIVANLRSMSPPSESLVGIRRIVGSGGALARNRTMQRAVTSLYGRPLVLNCDDDDVGDAALGAAFAALLKRQLASGK